ncbi:transcriptional regulator domain-containing protein [Nitrosomonas supralitoralis]|uniref:Transcriptional regulator-like domain-containing protein n=1 Tax=Nitrosomonas supralitoralis TaxID=2116706 RepID=A0A2P7NSW7_9PROT|nr:DUF6499 domain-containing protein [Nitrosomonas supralitoralis]PSJ16550.1 hypothetical protein C7H79_12880 [Nitrosomonas supralitoralis]
MKKLAWKLINWIDLKNYEHIEEDSSDEVYAWEFLRRNKQYQNDYSVYERTKKFPGYTRYTLSSEGQYISHNEDMLDWYRLSREFINIDPKITTLPAFVKGDCPRYLQKDDFLGFDATDDTDKEILELRQDEVVVVLSTSLNLDNQFDRIKDQLKLKKDTNGGFRKRKDKYITYLRLLDAELMDIPEAEILNVLYPKEEKSRTTIFNNLKAAKKLRDFNYKKLLAF